MTGFALVTCVGAFFYAVFLLSTMKVVRESWLLHRLPMPPKREAWLRQQEWLKKELDR